MSYVSEWLDLTVFLGTADSEVHIVHVSYVYPASDWYSASVPVIIYVISYHIGPRYDSTRLYYINVTWASWCLKSLATGLFVQQSVWASIKENIKTWLLAFVRGIHRWLVDSPHKGPVMWKLFLCHDIIMYSGDELNTMRPRQNGRHFSDDTFKRIFLNKNVSISIKISLKFVPKGPINNIPAMVQIMARRRPGNKPLFEPMMARSLTHICVTRPQWAHTVYYVMLWLFMICFVYHTTKCICIIR